jgi:hypothetical protein
VASSRIVNWRIFLSRSLDWIWVFTTANARCDVTACVLLALILSFR